MLKRKLENGMTAGLSLAATENGVVITLDNRNAKDQPVLMISCDLNPVMAIRLYGKLLGSSCTISSGASVLTYSHEFDQRSKPELSLQCGNAKVSFPLRVEEIHFLRRALEDMSSHLMESRVWCGEAAE